MIGWRGTKSIMKLYYDIDLASKNTEKLIATGEPEITESEIIFTLESGDRKIYKKQDVARHVMITFESFSP